MNGWMNEWNEWSEMSIHMDRWMNTGLDWRLISTVIVHAIVFGLQMFTTTQHDHSVLL